MMQLEPRDAVTIFIGAASLSSLYYALKKNVDKINITVRNMDTHHKREVSAIHHRIDEIKKDTQSSIDKIEGKIDSISNSVNIINASLSELNGYLKAQKK
jgi:hypothetical protein